MENNEEKVLLIINKLDYRDLIAYKRLITQLTSGLYNPTIGKYISILIKFINEEYESNENDLFELDDLIQESLLLISRIDKNQENIEKLIYSEIKETYEELRNNQQKSKIIKENKNIYEIDYIFKKVNIRKK